MPEYLYTFDLGTTGVKAGVLTPEGDLLDTSYREYGVVHPHPQWVEQSIATMWEAQCEAAWELNRRSGIDPGDVAAIAVSSQRATFVPVDKNGLALTRLIGWQDKRSIDQCERMREIVGSERYYSIAGLPIEPTAAVSKILWLKDNQPDLFERTKTFASTQNLHLQQLGVENAPCDLPNAAYMGLLDVDELRWSAELLDLLDIPEEKMPELAPSGRIVGELSKAAAEATGLRAGIPVATAGGDLQCAGLGMGVAAPGVISVGIGTGGGILTYLERPLRYPGGALNCLPHAVEGAWEMEGICLASGAAFKWYRDVLGQAEKHEADKLGVEPYDILNDQAAKAPPGSGGLLVMPSLVGAGAPNWYPKARGAILGLTLSSDKKALTRAMLEGICLEIRWMLESVRELGTQIDEIRIWGGAAKSGVWNQIAVDVYGIPATKTAVPEAGLVGAAICAGVGAGIFSDAREGVQAMIRVEGSYEPNPTLRSLYDEMFEMYKTVYRALVNSGFFERVAKL